MHRAQLQYTVYSAVQPVVVGPLYEAAKLLPCIFGDEICVAGVNLPVVFRVRS